MPLWEAALSYNCCPSQMVCGARIALKTRMPLSHKLVFTGWAEEVGSQWNQPCVLPPCAHGILKEWVSWKVSKLACFQRLLTAKTDSCN